MYSIQFSPLIIGTGTMRLGEWGVKLDSKELERFIDQCIEMGFMDFDHADIYGHYTEEGNFGRVLKRRPDLVQKVQITTKCGIKLVTERRPHHRIKSYDSTPQHIISSVENSLKEFGVEQIGVLLLHRPDYLMNVEEIAEAFERLRSEGKVKAFGVSNFTPAQVELLNGHTPLVTHQVEISLMQRRALEDGTLDQCQRLKILPTAWSPFGGGQIFGKSEEAIYQRIKSASAGLGEKYNAGLDQILLAWILKHPAGIIPIVGSSKIERIEHAKDALDIVLSHEDWYTLLEAAVGEEVP